MKRFAMLAKIGGIFSNTRNSVRGRLREGGNDAAEGEAAPQQIEVQPRKPSQPSTLPLSPQPGPSGVNTSTYRSSRGPSDIVLDSLGHLTIEVNSDDEYDESELPSPYYKFRKISGKTEHSTDNPTTPIKEEIATSSIDSDPEPRQTVKNGPEEQPGESHDQSQKNSTKNGLDSQKQLGGSSPPCKENKPQTVPEPDGRKSQGKEKSKGRVSSPPKQANKGAPGGPPKSEKNESQLQKGPLKGSTSLPKEVNGAKRRPQQPGKENVKLVESRKGISQEQYGESISQSQKKSERNKLDPPQEKGENERGQPSDTNDPEVGQFQLESGERPSPSHSGNDNDEPEIPPGSNENNSSPQNSQDEPSRERRAQNPSESSLRRRRRNRDIVLDNLGDLFPIENEEEEDDIQRNEGALSPLYILLNSICFVGGSPFWYDMHGSINIYLKKIPFYIIQTLLLFQTMLLVRKCIWFGEYITGDSEIFSYIQLGKSVIQLLLRWTFTITMILKKDQIRELLRDNADPLFNKLLAYKSIWDWLPFMLNALLSLLIVILETFMFENHGEDNPVKAILKSKALATLGLIFCRNLEQYMDYIENKSVNGTTVIHTIVGSISILWNFYSLLVDQFAGLLIVLVALNLFSSAACLELKSWNLSVNKTALINNYKKWKIKGQLSNNIISIIYPIFLIDNLLHLANCYNSSFNPEVTKLNKILLGLQTIQILLLLAIGHIIAVKVASKRDWVHNQCYNAVEEPPLYLLLEEMTSMPVGIGDDFLYICKAFIFNYFALSFAYFFSVVETRKSIESVNPCQCFCNGVEQPLPAN